MAQKKTEVSPQKDFLTDDEMKAMESSSSASDFMTDAEMTAHEKKYTPTSDFETPLNLIKNLWSLAPTGRQVAQMAGTAAGIALVPETGGLSALAAAGALGGGAAESAYQIGQQLTGSPEAPQSNTEALGRVGMAGLEGGLFGLIPEVARLHGISAGAQNTWHPAIPYMKRLTGQILTPSESLLTKALSPSDRQFQRYIRKGLDELKEASRAMGGTGGVKGGLRGLDIQAARNNNMIEQIVEPQRTIMTPDEVRDAIVRAEKAAIPADTTPAKRAELIAQADARHPGNYTIGELNTLRSELSATQSPFYGKDISGQLTMDASQRAIDIARGNEIRRQFYRSLDVYGLGGGEAAAEINSRIGAGIHFKDAFADQLNKSVSQQKGLAMKVMHPIKTVTGSDNIDAVIDKAVNRWKTTPRPVKMTLAPRVAGTEGVQIDLFPDDKLLTAPPGLLERYGIPERSLLEGPSGTSSRISQEIEKVRQRVAREARTAPPETISGAQKDFGFMPEPLGFSQFGPTSALTPEEQYLELMRQRRMWQAGAPVKPKGQLGLETMTPPEMFGIKAPTPTKPKPMPSH